MVVPVSAAAVPEPASGGLDSTAVFRSEFRYVWSSLRRLGVQERDLEDLTHEVFVRVHDQLPLFDEARPLRPWLFGIALGLATNYRRLARHRVDLVAEVPERSDPSVAAEEVLLERERAQLVQGALQKVPLEQRAVLVLHELDGYTIPDVAATLGLTLNTAYSRLRLGRDCFRAAFRRVASQRGFS
ncbi:MAG TPA: sigma-70 family RNA polymerase sigma factor [Polyangiaceae bacterium]|nr:sigma-70 family RNA polymerase sigma factor [Polyangiaceae bacterium]